MGYRNRFTPAVVLVLCGLVCSPPATATVNLHDLRVAKCRYIVDHLYPHSGFAPYCEFLITEHERLEYEHGQRAHGYSAAWWWSLVYGGANFSLRVGAVAPGHCAGPMDVKHWPLVLDPEVNIQYHCREMLHFYKRGVRGLSLCEHVFYPRRPHDWGGGRFRRTHRAHLRAIEQMIATGVYEEVLRRCTQEEQSNDSEQSVSVSPGEP